MTSVDQSALIAPNTMDNFQLLSLPGELLNQIFNYCQETIPFYENDDESWFDALYLHHEPSSSKPARLIQDRRQFFGLTQTCRKLRAEFRPLYMAQTQVYIKLQEVSNYMEAFLPSTNMAATQCHQANFVILVPMALEHKVDLIPLIELRLHAPHVKFFFCVPLSTNTHTLSGLTSDPTGSKATLRVIQTCIFPDTVDIRPSPFESLPSRSVKQLGSLVQSIERLELRIPTPSMFGSYPQELHITFNKDVYETWMDGALRTIQDMKVMIWLGSSSFLQFSEFGKQLRTLLDAMAHAGGSHKWIVRTVCE
jgi:hypothetical protein